MSAGEEKPTGRGEFDRKGLALASVAALAALLVALPGLRLPFDDIPEPLEALVVQEMAASGDWVLPRRNGTEIPSKPPLYHWVAVALSAPLGGVSEASTRLPSALFASLAVGWVAAFAAAEWGLVAAAAAAVALTTSPEWARWAVTARTDATFAFFVAATLLAAAGWLRRGSRASLLVAAAAAGAAVLSKGPAGVFLPVLVVALEIARRKAWARLQPGALAAAAGIFVVIAASWYVAALTRGGADFFQKQIVSENLLRFLPSDEGGPSRDHSMFFYFGALAVGMGPWFVALPAALARAWREGRAGVGKTRGDDTAVFLLVWIAVIFSVCTFASGKRSNYILPLYPAAALLVGREVSLRLERAARGRAFGLAVVGWGVAALFGIVAAFLVLWRTGLEPWRLVLGFLHPRDRELVPILAASLGPPPLLLLGSVTIAALVVALLTRRRSWPLLAATLAASSLGLTFLVNAIVRPVESGLKTFRPFAERVASRVSDGRPLFFFRKPQYAVLFYLHRHVPVEAVDFGRIPAPAWVLVWEEDWGEIASAPRARGAAVVEESPPAALNRKASRLFLVKM